MRVHPFALLSALGVLAQHGAVVSALDYPIGITNCGVQSWIPSPPKRAVTMNQGTTEVMLALGLEDRMAGTAYLDDYIWPELVSLAVMYCLRVVALDMYNSHQRYENSLR